MSPSLSTANFSNTSWFAESRKHRIGRKDIAFNIQAIDSLAAASKKYEEALRAVSDASIQFAEALDTFARVKDLERPEDEEDMVDGLRSLSGYQYYVASQQRVLSSVVKAQCTAPLQEQATAYRTALMVLILRTS
jgi:hypothetical protein